MKYISSDLWKLVGKTPQTNWKTYGLESESSIKYEEQTKYKVALSGLWVNPIFPILAWSPNGLPRQGALLEIKSLKIFKEHSIERTAKRG